MCFLHAFFLTQLRGSFPDLSSFQPGALLQMLERPLDILHPIWRRTVKGTQHPGQPQDRLRW